MNPRILELTNAMELRPGASDEALQRLEVEFDIRFPDDYREFMLHADGAEGPIGNSYLGLWSVEVLRESNRDSEIQLWMPGLVAFGSDMGAMGYAFDTNDPTLPIREFDFIVKEIDAAPVRAASFLDFLEYLYTIRSEEA